MKKRTSKKTNSYSMLETPHAKVHNDTREVFDLITRPNLDAEKLVQAFSKMEHGSDEIFSILDKIILHEKE